MKNYLQKLQDFKYLPLVGFFIGMLVGSFELLAQNIYCDCLGAFDFVIAGFNLGGFFYKRIVDKNIESLQKIIEELDKVQPMKKTEEGYISPFQIKR